MPINAHDQPIGATIEGWVPRPRPPRTGIVGRTCRIEPLDVARHVPIHGMPGSHEDFLKRFPGGTQ